MVQLHSNTSIGMATVEVIEMYKHTSYTRVPCCSGIERIKAAPQGVVGLIHVVTLRNSSFIEVNLSSSDCNMDVNCSVLS